MLGNGLVFSLFLAYVSSTPLDDYVWAPDENYGWNRLVGVELIKFYVLGGARFQWYLWELLIHR